MTRYVRENIKYADGIGVSIDAGMIQYWSLPLKGAKDAAVRVSNYLNGFSKTQGLFCLVHQDPTIEFAKKYARSDTNCNTTWNSYQNYVAAKVAERNSQIEKKRKEVINTHIPSTYGAEYIEYVSGDYDGHWFPDYSKVFLTWMHGCPHTVQIYAKSYFTEVVNEDVQFTVSYPNESDSTRGNLTYAKHGKKKDLSYKAFVGLGAIRSYPFNQFRMVLALLTEQILPLEKTLVKQVIYSSLFQLGPFTSKYHRHVDQWHHDFHTGGLEQLRNAMTHLIGNLGETIRQAKQMELVARVSSYLCQYLDSDDELFDLLVKANLNWIDLEAEKTVGMSVSKVSYELKANEWLKHAYLILCFEFVPVSKKTLNCFVRSIVMYHHLQLYGLESTLKGEILRLRSMVKYIIARQQTAMIQLLSEDNYAALTKVLVYFDPECPAMLTWNRLGNSTWLEARSKSFYCINVLTGEYLQNGAPPSRLPSNVLNDECFKSIFGLHNFEVAIDDNGWFQTMHPVSGYYYKIILANQFWLKEIHNR